MARTAAVREEVAFESGGERCAAWLYLPDGERRHPLVILAHGFGATRSGRLWAYAERFRDAGLGALVFDYRHFGDSGGEPRQLLRIRRQLADWDAALAYARAREDIDAMRIALWGTSLSGGHVVRVAAGDGGAAAVVSQCPVASGLSTLRVAGAGHALRLVAAGLRDGAAALRGAAPYTIPIVARPGEMGAMSSPDALPGYSAMFEDGFRNEVAARIALTFGLYSPARSAPRLRCPLLVCACERDAVARARDAVRMAERAPRGELVRYDIGHFDIYVADAFERAVADQVAFLRRHLLPAER